MKKNDVSRMDSWIDSRLEKMRSQNRQIDTQELLVELTNSFNIKITKKNERAMKTKVLKIRNRVNKRHERTLKFYQQMATDLGMPVKMIERWTHKGWIIPNSKKSNKNLVNLFLEMQYYRMFEPNVPENIEDPIWYD